QAARLISSRNAASLFRTFPTRTSTDRPASMRPGKAAGSPTAARPGSPRSPNQVAHFSRGRDDGHTTMNGTAELVGTVVMIGKVRVVSPRWPDPSSAPKAWPSPAATHRGDGLTGTGRAQASRQR